MNKWSFHILRFFVAATFLWIGIAMWREPLSWAGYLSPWALDLVPFSPELFMRITALFDIVIALLLLLNLFVAVVGYIIALHMLGILIGGGVNDITVRDIAILGSGLAFAWGACAHKKFMWWRP